MVKDNSLIGLDLLDGNVTRGDTPIMTVKELIFLLRSAVKFDESFPCEESKEFLIELRDAVGTGYTAEQFAEVQKQIKAFMSNEN